MVQKIQNLGKNRGIPSHPTGVLLPAIERDLQRRRLDPEDQLGPLPTAKGTRLRASYALTCARQIGFNIIGLPEDDEVPAQVLFTFDIGHVIHKMVQGVAERELPDARSEVDGEYPDEWDISSHADLVYTQMLFNPGFDDVPVNVCGEIKSISGYGFLIAVGARKSSDGELPGPKVEHICQAAICAIATNINAKKIHLIYLDKDKANIAEWILDMDEPQEKLEGLSPRDLALSEIERMQGILGRLDSGMLPARHIPGVGRVQIVPDPESKGQPWNCRYCRWNPTCQQLPPGPVSFEDAGIPIKLTEKGPIYEGNGAQGEGEAHGAGT